MDVQSLSRTTTESVLRQTTTTSRPTGHSSRSRPRTAATSTNLSYNEIICAITESRGISSTIGLSFVNVSTSEAILCQFADTQTYARTCHKIKVFSPSEIVYMSTAEESQLLSIVKENLEVDRNDVIMTSIDRRYWSESTGHEYLQQLAFPDDFESLKVSMGCNYFSSCCFAAVGFSKGLWLVLILLGAQIHWTWLSHHFRCSITSYQVRTVGRVDDDWSLYYYVSWVDPKSTENKFERLLIRTVERNSDSNGCSISPKQHSSAIHRHCKDSTAIWCTHRVDNKGTNVLRHPTRLPNCPNAFVKIWPLIQLWSLSLTLIESSIRQALQREIFASR